MTFSIKTIGCLVCFLLVAHVARGTVFTAKGQLRCYTDRIWCFYISYWEEDPLFKDDRIDFMGVQCVRYGDYFSYHLKGEEEGDGLLNNYYELVMYVRHNCTSDGQLRMVTNRLPPKSVAIPSFEIRWDVDLTDNGEKVDTYFFKNRIY